MSGFRSLLLRFLIILCIPVLLSFAGQAAAASAPEEESPFSDVSSFAQDISRQCAFNGWSGASHILTDGKYSEGYTVGFSKESTRSLRITAPEGETIGGVYLQWRCAPVPLDLQIQDAGGTWVTFLSVDEHFYAQYIPLDGLHDFRLQGRDNPRTVLEFYEIRVFGPGEPPPEVQRWQSPGEKTDLMLIVGHPDDELLWFGGLLPVYAGEQQKSVLVVCASMNRSWRRLELLDALWTCGVRVHPVFSLLEDFVTSFRDDALQRWGGEEKCLQLFTSYIRKYRPDVLVLHDINGEYGHGIHQAVSWLGMQGAGLAADPAKYPDQVSAWGIWDVPKVYIHLWPENQLRLNWNQPLAAFQGRTGLQVASEAMQCHRSQLSRGWAVQEGGDMDNALFGLWRTNVGPDELKNDLFEHLGPESRQ